MMFIRLKLQGIFVCIVILISNMFSLVNTTLMAEGGSTIRDALVVHNRARTQANGSTRPSLIWSQDLSIAAQSWANHLASLDKMQHSSGSGQGENLYSHIGNGDSSFFTAAAAWVSEKPLYQGERIPKGNFAAYGHYTQVIWPSTREVGMGSAKSVRGWTYVVARYSPPGNHLNQTAWS